MMGDDGSGISGRACGAAIFRRVGLEAGLVFLLWLLGFIGRGEELDRWCMNGRTSREDKVEVGVTDALLLEQEQGLGESDKAFVNRLSHSSF